MKYLILLEGHGGGCDYTIGCNKKWEFIEAGSIQDARDKVALILEDHGCEEGCSRIAKATIIEPASISDFKISGWEADKAKERRELQERELEKREKADFERLKEKFGGKK